MTSSDTSLSATGNTTTLRVIPQGLVSSLATSSVQGTELLRTYGQIFILLLTGCCCLLTSTNMLQAEEVKHVAAVAVKVDALEVGYQGLIKPGFWTPVVCRISGVSNQAEAAQLHLVVLTEDDQGDSIQVDLGAFTEQNETGHFTKTSWFKYGHPLSPLQFQLIEMKNSQLEMKHQQRQVLFTLQSKDLTPAPRLIKPENSIVLFAGDVEKIANVKDGSPAILRTSTPDMISLVWKNGAIPLDPLASDPLRAVIYIGEGGVKQAAAQSESLQAWVRGGGHALFSFGTSPELLTSSPLQQWLPLSLDKTLTLRDYGALQNFAEQSTGLWSARPISAFSFQKVEKKLIQAIEGILAGRSSYGFGHVTMAGYNLNAEPLDTWRSLPRYFEKLLDVAVYKSGTKNVSASRRLTQTGVTDMKTQIQAGISESMGSQSFPLWVIFIVLIGFIILVGPLDYWLCHVVLRRPHWGWITMPIWALSVAYFFSTFVSGFHGTDTRTSQLNLIDYDLRQGAYRIQHISELFYPRTEQVQLELGSPQPFAEISAQTMPLTSTRSSWNGEQEATFGGIQRIQSSARVSGNYELGKLRGQNSTTIPAGTVFQFDQLPLRQWSAREFQWISAGQLTAPANESDAQAGMNPFLSANLKGHPSGQLTGLLGNVSKLPFKNWLLAFGRRVYYAEDRDDVSTIQPNQRIKLDDSRKVRSRDLEGYFTNASTLTVKREKGTGEDIIVKREEYDPNQRDMLQIIRTLTFYDVLGGEDYTSLKNQELYSMDLSSFLDADCAVFMAEISDPDLCPIKIAQQQEIKKTSNSYLRVLIPVDRTALRNGQGATVPGPTSSGPKKEDSF
jgi:hypothetical protein